MGFAQTRHLFTARKRPWLRSNDKRNLQTTCESSNSGLDADTSSSRHVLIKPVSYPSDFRRFTILSEVHSWAVPKLVRSSLPEHASVTEQCARLHGKPWDYEHSSYQLSTLCLSSGICLRHRVTGLAVLGTEDLQTPETAYVKKGPLQYSQALQSLSKMRCSMIAT
jgi:hypothetical protein